MTMMEAKAQTENTKANIEVTDGQPPTKEKIRNIMEAASALTALGDEESESGSLGGTLKNPKQVKVASDAAATPKQSKKEEAEEDDPPKRYLPEHKKADSALTFPEKLMKMMKSTENKGEGYCVAWCDDGKSFIIRNPDDFTRQVVPKFFKATKFSSFTRKLYRWGFRQINRGIGPDDPIIFGNECFQKGNEALIAKMRSVTAASARKAEQVSLPGMIPGMSGMKRPYEDTYDETSQKRMFFDQFMHQQKHMGLINQGQFYGGMNPNGSIPLSNALRPGLGMGPNPGMPPSMGNPAMMMGHAAGQSGMMMNPAMIPMGNTPYMQHGHSGMPSGQYPNGPQYPTPQTTAEIVNAAIAALRHAN